MKLSTYLSPLSDFLCKVKYMQNGHTLSTAFFKASKLLSEFTSTGMKATKL